MRINHEFRCETLKEHSFRDPFGSMKEPPAKTREGEDLGLSQVNHEKSHNLEELG